DGMGRFIVGLTPQIRLGNRVALTLAGSFIGSFNQDRTFDGTAPAGGRGFAGKMFNASIGLQFYLGKNDIHADWYKSGSALASRVTDLEDRVSKIESDLDDADGDGVASYVDDCPDTPAGGPVDVNGCPLDTDGDGVADFEDNQLITPTYCQPVDEDGVGKCPVQKAEKPACHLGTLPTINFEGNDVALSNSAKSLLGNVANQMRQSPACRVVVSGHASSSKASEQLAWDRVNSIINYMTEEEGIPASRFVFKYHAAGDTHSVD